MKIESKLVYYTTAATAAIAKAIWDLYERDYRVPHFILDQKVMKDLIRQGRMEVHSELGKKLEQEVLDEWKKRGVN